MENYFLYLKESGHHLEHVRLYNAADQDLTTWQQGKQAYTLENERLEPKWRFGSDDLSFQLDYFYIFLGPAVDFQGCILSGILFSLRFLFVR